MLNFFRNFLKQKARKLQPWERCRHCGADLKNENGVIVAYCLMNTCYQDLCKKCFDREYENHRQENEMLKMALGPEGLADNFKMTPKVFQNIKIGDEVYFFDLYFNPGKGIVRKLTACEGKFLLVSIDNDSEPHLAEDVSSDKEKFIEIITRRFTRKYDDTLKSVIKKIENL